MKIELSNLQKIYVLDDILRDLIYADVISEYTFGKLMGAYAVRKCICLRTLQRKDLGYDE